jgi:DNA-binding NtrC family response regulator
MAEPSQAEVLVVDADASVGRMVSGYLRSRGYACDWCADGEKAVARLDQRLVDVLVTSLTAPRVGGLRLMEIARSRNPHVCVVLLLDEGEIAQGTAGVRAGAHDFQTKPVNMEKLEGVIEHGLAFQRLALAQAALHRRLDERFGLGGIAGRSPQMIRVYNAIREIGPTERPVLVYGEPGSGKRLIAEALHHNSPRRDETFVAFDCEGLPEVVVRSELFGYAVGKHLGASPLRTGRFALAQGGTLYLDGLDTLSPTLQHRLRDVLQSGMLSRIDTGERVKVDVRLVAASSRPLAPLVAMEAFDGELYELLSTVTIEAPPLRERREDIPVLVHDFVRASSERHGLPVPVVSEGALDTLTRYGWPANVRELENVTEAMVLASAGRGALEPRDVPEAIREGAILGAGEYRLHVGMTLHEVERVAIEESMRACHGNKEACARMLRIGLRTLYRKLKEYEEGGAPGAP